MSKHRGDRRDGIYLKNIDSMHTIMPLMYPNRCDNEAFISERIDLTNINAYLEKKNAGNPEYAYNLFQIMVTALLKVITLRPKMNRFIANKSCPLATLRTATPPTASTTRFSGRSLSAAARKRTPPPPPWTSSRKHRGDC